MRPLSHRFPALRWQPREVVAAPTERTWRSRPLRSAPLRARARVYRPVRLARPPVTARTWRVRPLTTEARGRARVYQPYRLTRLPVTARTWRSRPQGPAPLRVRSRVYQPFRLTRPPVTERTLPATYQPGRGRRRSPARVYWNVLRREEAVAPQERIVSGRFGPVYARRRRGKSDVYQALFIAAHLRTLPATLVQARRAQGRGRVYTVRPPKGVSRRRGFVRVI